MQTNLPATALAIISAFCADLQKRAIAQLDYDLKSNVPFGILSPAEAAEGSHALRLAIVSAVGSFVHYDIHGALEIAADIADDVNAHPEAAQIRAMVI
jgi:hypothetical protein